MHTFIKRSRRDNYFTFTLQSGRLTDVRQCNSSLNEREDTKRKKKHLKHYESNVLYIGTARYRHSNGFHLDKQEALRFSIPRERLAYLRGAVQQQRPQLRQQLQLFK